MSRIHRRSFLERLGLGVGAGLLSPITRTLLAQAQGTFGPRKRLIVVMQSNGFHMRSFIPAEYKTSDKIVYGKTLIDTDKFTLPPKFAPLAPYRDKMVLVDGLVNQQGQGGHTCAYVGMSCVPLPTPITGEAATGGAGGQTFDQYVASRIGRDTPYASVHLGARTPKGTEVAPLLTGFYARGKGDAVPIVARAKDAYAQLLGKPVDAATSAQLEAERKAELIAKQKLLAFVDDDVKRLRAQLAGTEKAKLDEYLASVEDAGRRLTTFGNMPVTGCGTSALMTEPALPEDRFAAMVDIGTAAIACGLTNVLTLNLVGIGSAFSSLGLQESLHSVGHGYGGDEWHIKITSFFSEQIARMIAKLSSIREGDGTVFDNTVIAFLSDNAENHHCRAFRWPVLLVGNAGGGLRTGGRYLRYPARNSSRESTPTNVEPGQRALADLWTTLSHAMNIPIEFGKGGMEKLEGPLRELLPA